MKPSGCTGIQGTVAGAKAVGRHQGWDEPMEELLSCRELLTFVAQYVAGQLTAEVRDEFERHLAHCDECVRYLNDFPAIVRLAASCGRENGGISPEVPSELVAAVLASRGQGLS